MKFAKTLAGIVFVSGLLVGCGHSSATSNQPQSNEIQTANTANTDNMTQQTSGIRQGITSMLGVTANLTTQIAAGDRGKSEASGEQLEATWHAFEDAVQHQYPSAYKDVETYLDPLVAGTKASSLDKKALTNLNQQLRHSLQNLQANVK